MIPSRNKIGDLADEQVQSKLEAMRDELRREIRKELRIKEGAEKMRKASKKGHDKRAVDAVKESDEKLVHLQLKLQDVNAHLLRASEQQQQQPMPSTPVSSNFDANANGLSSRKCFDLIYGEIVYTTVFVSDKTYVYIHQCLWYAGLFLMYGFVSNIPSCKMYSVQFASFAQNM